MSTTLGDPIDHADRIAIEGAQGRTQRFLNHFRVALAGSLRGSVSDFADDGRYYQRFTGVVGAGEEPLEFTLWWSKDHRPESIEVHPPTTEASRAFLANALATASGSAQRDDLERFFVSESFSYFGTAPIQDELRSGGNRVVFLSPDSSGGPFVEQLAVVEVVSEGVDATHAMNLGRSATSRFAAALSTFAGIGFFRTRQEVRWVWESNERWRRYQLFGPLNGTQCTSEPLPSESFAWLRQRLAPGVGGPTRVAMYERRDAVPATVQRGLDALEALAPEARERFDGAARLVQTALTLARYSSSMELAYHVAAVDALIEQKSGRAAFVEAVSRWCPSIPKGWAWEAYVSMRSRHFHKGLAVGTDRFGGLITMIHEPEVVDATSKAVLIPHYMRQAVLGWLWEQTA